MFVPMGRDDPIVGCKNSIGMSEKENSSMPEAV